MSIVRWNLRPVIFFGVEKGQGGRGGGGRGTGEGGKGEGRKRRRGREEEEKGKGGRGEGEGETGEGGRGIQARETGTMWQIGVLTWTPCTFGHFEGFLGFLARWNPFLCYEFQ